MKIWEKTMSRVVLAAAFLFCAVCLSACGKESGTKVVFTTGLAKNEVFKIGSVTCTDSEMMLYLTNTQNQYENVYGEGIWNTAADGVTLEENVKETVLAKLAQIKSMYLLAKEKGLALDEEEEKLVKSASESYFGSLNDKEKELLGVTLETVEELYREYALADKVYQHIIRDVNPEISDDEARTITVQHILIRTGKYDGAGNWVPFSDSEKQEAYERAVDIRMLALEEGQDFADLASKNSDDTDITYSFGKGEMEESYEAEAFSLETDQVSRIVETKEGYCIIKCVNTFNREETDANKLEIAEERKNEAFGLEYNSFVAGLARDLNEELWENIAFIRDESVTTADFFEVYEKYFK